MICRCAVSGSCIVWLGRPYCNDEQMTVSHICLELSRVPDLYSCLGEFFSRRVTEVLNMDANVSMERSASLCRGKGVQHLTPVSCMHGTYVHCI